MQWQALFSVTGAARSLGPPPTRRGGAACRTGHPAGERGPVALGQLLRLVPLVAVTLPVGFACPRRTGRGPCCTTAVPSAAPSRRLASVHIRQTKGGKSRNAMQLDAEQLRSAPCSYAAAQLNLAQCNIFSKKKLFC